MGSASSKAARKLPQDKPAWTGVRAQRPAAATEPAHPRLQRPLGLESDHQAIDGDAGKDPRFMAKLSQLGQVRVGHGHGGHHHHARTASEVQRMYRSRLRSEADASRLSGPGAARNRLLASVLAELLEARKSVADGAELERLAQRYHVDVATVQLLGRVVNTPSVDESTVVRTRDKHGEESLTMMAQWVDPSLSRA